MQTIPEISANAVRMAHGPRAIGNGELICVVDDEVGVLKMVACILTRGGYQVLPAANGHEALRQMENNAEIRVVLTDITMPVMDGVTLIRTLVPMYPAVKIIASTGLPSAALTKQLIDLGVHDFLTKPFSPARLLATLGGVIHGETRCLDGSTADL